MPFSRVRRKAFSVSLITCTRGKGSTARRNSLDTRLGPCLCLTLNRHTSSSGRRLRCCPNAQPIFDVLLSVCDFFLEQTCLYQQLSGVVFDNCIHHCCHNLTAHEVWIVSLRTYAMCAYDSSPDGSSNHVLTIMVFVVSLLGCGYTCVSEM